MNTGSQSRAILLAGGDATNYECHQEGVNREAKGGSKLKPTHKHCRVNPQQIPLTVKVICVALV